MAESLIYNNALTYNTFYDYMGNAAAPILVIGDYRELAGVLNQLASTSGLGAAGAANVYAGTTGLELVAALNVKAGNAAKVFREFDGVCNQLASTSGWSGVGALNKLAGNLIP